MAQYEILIGVYDIYPANLIDNNAKIDWSKGDNGLIFEKKLDGNFVLFRSGNEALYDAIKNMTICEDARIRVLDPTPLDPIKPFIVFGIFGIRDIEYKDDKCQMIIKPRYLDPNDVDTIMDKDLNIINTKFDAHTITYNENYQFETISYTKSNVYCDDLVYDLNTSQWYSTTHRDVPQLKIFNGQEIRGNIYNYQRWSYFSQINIKVNDNDDLPYFHVTTTWFREIKLIPKSIDPQNDMYPPQGDSSYSFQDPLPTTINEILYNKYYRYVSGIEPYTIYNNHSANSHSYILWGITDYYGKNKIRTLTRARKLIDILEYYKEEFNCTSLHSEFFTNNANPVSGADLTNLMIEQKSDVKFENDAERTDPARLGIITFRKLMEQLKAMFQVEWTIIDNVLYIEHISFFKWNFSYTQNTRVGLDLTSYYPLCLTGSNSYTYEQNIPIREKFTFMEAWNIDFVGTDIEYTNCIKEGNSETYSADLITTDIDPTYIDTEASNDGFVIFHCNEENEVISEDGMISKISSPNAHLSWANLHYYYWKSYRWVVSGMMNNKLTYFISPYRKLKKQTTLEFPFCAQNVDDLIYDLVTTTLGDGDIEHVEYSFKTGNIKIELSYGSA